MTITSFFRRMALLPLVLPVVAGLTAALAHQLGGHRSTPTPPWVELSLFVAYAGAASTPPYLLYLALVFGLWRPRDEKQFRRSVWLAPFIIGLPFGALSALRSKPDNLSEAVAPFLFGSSLAITVGLAYALLITILRGIAKIHGWIEASPRYTQTP